MINPLKKKETKIDYQQQKEEMDDIFNDIPKWAYCFIQIRDRATGKLVPWTARQYQAKAMRNHSYKKVMRWGRRCGKTEAAIIEMLYWCSKIPGYRVIIVTPFESQIRLIYMRLFELIEDSPLIKMGIKSKTKNPYTITFKNGAAILGFTAGTKSGQGAASIRGQKADLIYMDEADYLQDNEIEAIVAIALERPDIRITLTSTPTGKRAFFYKACTMPEMGYQEFYAPSTDLPNWSDKMEAEFRAMFSEVGYQHEVLAEFGSEVTGVFDKTQIDRAIDQEQYYYMELTNQQAMYVRDNKLRPKNLCIYNVNNIAPLALRTMGIDWDKYGEVSTIIVTEFDLRTGRLKPVYRSDIPKGDFSLDYAVKKIVELNTIYNPKFIYCDRGFGEYQIETLRIYGKEHPESMLDKKVKGWHFGQNIDIIDPVTKVPDKKPLKHFMISQLQLLLSRGQLVLSPYDELLYRQLINYCVIKVTDSGRPIFTSEDEHALDALMLSITAFVLEMPEVLQTIFKPQKQLSVSFMKNSPTVQAAASLFNKINAAKNNYNRAKQNYNDDLKCDRPPNIVRRDGNYKSTSNSWAGRGSGGRNVSRRSNF